jgi:C4-dicarboxylate-specific signal transduction histidine kinase
VGMTKRLYLQLMIYPIVLLFLFIILLNIFQLKENLEIIFILILVVFYIPILKITKVIKEKDSKIEELTNTLQEKVTLKVEELRSQDLILSQKSKAQSLGEMLTLITHQWRQPLNVINSITAKIYRDCKINTLNTAEVEENIAQIEELTYYMSQTMSDFSSFYKTSKDEEYFQINDVVNKTLNILFPKYYKDVKPEIKFTFQDEITLYGYKSQMQQILLSILNNCIENFNIKNTKEPKISIDIIKKGDIALINIEDNGGGIHEIDLNKVFELYYTTKEDTKSRGMGLYIAKMMSQACLHGDLKVDNTKDGAIFTISCGINAKV